LCCARRLTGENSEAHARRGERHRSHCCEGKDRAFHAPQSKTEGLFRSAAMMPTQADIAVSSGLRHQRPANYVTNDLRQPDSDVGMETDPSRRGSSVADPVLVVIMLLTIPKMAPAIHTHSPAPRAK
jgi:hypothetical protein